MQEALNGSLRDRLVYFHAGLRLHFRREEEALFPDARRMVSDGAAKVDIIGRFFGEEADDDLNAHAALGSRVEEMIAILERVQAAGALDEQSRTRLRALFSVVDSLFQRHATKEDRFIFPMVARALTPAQQQAVLDRLAAIRPEQDPTDPRMRRGKGLTELNAEADE
jgi:iron-sulfur cluster repair protein YtfE (RIC family)